MKLIQDGCSWCHEERRVQPVGRLDLVDEDEWFDSLDDREQARIVRELNAVDRAVDGFRKRPAA